MILITFFINLITKEKDKEPVEEKYTGEPIPFRGFEARITSFEKLLDKNNMPIPETWVDDESIINEKDIDVSKLYNPRKTIYKQVWEELIKINNSDLNDIDDYGWEGIVSRIPSIKHDEENELISGTDEFGEPDNIEIKSFQNTFSTMKQRLKNRKI